MFNQELRKLRKFVLQRIRQTVWPKQKRSSIGKLKKFTQGRWRMLLFTSLDLNVCFNLKGSKMNSNQTLMEFP